MPLYICICIYFIDSNKPDSREHTSSSGTSWSWFMSMAGNSGSGLSCSQMNKKPSGTPFCSCSNSSSNSNTALLGTPDAAGMERETDRGDQGTLAHLIDQNLDDIILCKNMLFNQNFKWVNSWKVFSSRKVLMDDDCNQGKDDYSGIQESYIRLAGV